MVGASGPVRGPHPIRASGKSVKDDSSPVQGPHPIQKSIRRRGLVAGVSQTSDPRRPALKALPNLSLNVSDTLRATRAE